MSKCIVCGLEKEDAKRDCGRHTYQEYKKVKSLVWNDPWPYFPISFIGFWVVLYPLSFLVSPIPSTDGILIIIISAMIPSLASCYLHYIRQKRKDLPFWGLTDDQEVARVNNGVEG